MYPQQKRREHLADLTNAITRAKHTEVDRLAAEGIINLLHDRSRALAFICNFEEAENESRRIIARAPRLAVGYLSLGDNLQAQGKYAAAIRIYERGLTNATSESDNYAQLEKAKAMSVAKDAYRFDIITSATVEIAYNIFSMLDQSTRCICLNVCQKWRNILFSSRKAWHKVEFDNGISSFFNSIPIFGRYVKNACLSSKESWYPVLLSMQRSEFVSITSLSITAFDTSPNNQDRNTELIMTALKAIRSTLTYLLIDTRKSANVVIIVDDLLSTLHNLKTLIYKSIQQNHRITARNQEVNEAMDLHESLLDLELKAREIASADMAIILKRCTNVRRLVVLGCDIDCVRAVRDNYPSKLQILSVNNGSAVSPLEPDNVATGLTMLYTPNGGPGIDASALLPIIKNNASSLVVAKINIDCTNQQEDLGRLQLSNIRQMTLWCDKDGQELFVGALSRSSQLEYLTLLGVTDIDSLVGRLIASPLPLTTLRIFHTYNLEEAHSFSRLLSAMNRTLNIVEFGSCSGLSDETINALAHVTTLTRLSIASQPDVSADALFALFSSRTDSLKFVELISMRNATNNVRKSLGRAKQLRTLFIANLQKISDSGIMFIADHTKTISRLKIQNCNNIPASAIEYARCKIRIVSSA